MKDYWDDANYNFTDLPLFTKGESKEIRVVDSEHLIVKLIPSLYSYRKNKYSFVSDTEKLRLEAYKLLNEILQRAGIITSTIHFGSNYYISKRMLIDGKDYVPPIEVIVKGRHVGTPKHTLYNIGKYLTKYGGYIFPDRAHAPYVRFDYTNPLRDDKGERLRDECIPHGLAEHYINTSKAETTALKAYEVLFEFLSERGLRLDDICFKIDSTGEIIFGEVSPDCLRAVFVEKNADFFSSKGNDVSKDTFRGEATDQTVIDSYRHFLNLLSEPPSRQPQPLLQLFSCGS